MEDSIQRPLHWLVGNDVNFAQVEERLNDPNEKDFSGLALLHIAAKSLDHNSRIMKLLIDQGADLNATTPDGHTPLHLAVCQEQRDSIAALTEAGASVNVKDKLGRTALHFAVLKRPARSGNPYLNTHCDIWIVNFLLGHPEINVNAVDRMGETPLMWAVKGRHWKAVPPFLKKGANPNIANKYLRTPLHEALSAQIPIHFISQNLLLYGAGIYGADHSRLTPVDILLRNIHDNWTYEFAVYFVWEVALRYHVRDSLFRKLEKMTVILKHLEECCKEVRMMKKIVIYDNVTLHDVALNCFQTRAKDPVREIYVPMVESLLSGLFHKYFKCIFSRLSLLDLRDVLEVTAGRFVSRHLVPVNAESSDVYEEIGRAYDENVELKNRLLRFKNLEKKMK